MTYAYIEEETILKPRNTEFLIDAWLYATDNINSQNRYGEFSVVFAPVNFYEHQRLAELIESAVMEVELRKDRLSNKRAKAKTETSAGLFYSSQLFTPKVTPDFSHPDELRGLQASIRGHLRDLPNGDVVINVSYIDCYDPLNGIEEVEPSTGGASERNGNDDW